MSSTKRRLALLALILAAAIFPAPASAEDATPLSPAEQLCADFAILKRVYEELHPGLYHYNTKAQMGAHFCALEAELSRDLTLRQAYVAISAFLAGVRCGHTYAHFFNQPDAVADALFKGQDKVPFYFRWLVRQMIVTKNFSGDARLTPGTVVLAINGVPTGKILDRLLTVARTDGSNEAKRVSYLEVIGGSDYEAFDVELEDRGRPLLIGYFPPSPSPDAGLRPDVLVEPTVADIARGVDTELRAVEPLLLGRR